MFEFFLPRQNIISSCVGKEERKNDSAVENGSSVSHSAGHCLLVFGFPASERAEKNGIVGKLQRACLAKKKNAL